MSDKPEREHLTFDELQNEFQTWSSQHGDEDEMRNGMPFYRLRDTKSAMNALVLRFIEIGYSEKQIRGQIISTQLQTFCTSYRHPNKENWKKQIKRHWEFAINARFPATTEVIEPQPVEVPKSTTQLESPALPPKVIPKVETLDMTKHEGFGKPLREDFTENILADILKESNE